MIHEGAVDGVGLEGSAGIVIPAGKESSPPSSEIPGSSSESEVAVEVSKWVVAVSESKSICGVTVVVSK